MSELKLAWAKVARDDHIAIVEASGRGPSGTLYKVLACTEKSQIGKKWFGQNMPSGSGPFLVSMYLPDQFVHHVHLEDVRRVVT